MRKTFVSTKFCVLAMQLRTIRPPPSGGFHFWRSSWKSIRPQTSSAFEPTRVKTSKRQKGFPSETGVKRSLGSYRIVHGDKELLEKLGRNDPCPCHSGRRFQELLHEVGQIRRQ
jgi:hypothetical protein